MTIQESIRSIEESTARLREFMLRSWLRSETSMLPRWKRKPPSSLPDGQVVDNGRAHTVRTTYIRSQFHAGDVAYLRRVIEAPDPSTALQGYTTKLEPV